MTSRKLLTAADFVCTFDDKTKARFWRHAGNCALVEKAKP